MMGQAISGQCCNINPLYVWVSSLYGVCLYGKLSSVSFRAFHKNGSSKSLLVAFFSSKSTRLFWCGGNDCGVFSSLMLCKSRVYDLLLTDQSNIRYILRLMARQVILDLTSWAFAIFFQGDLCLYEIYLVMPVTTLAKY